jgi:hypothetical protein
MASWVGWSWRSLALGRELADRYPHLAAFFAGDRTRPDAQALTFQPIAALSIGRGYYIRSSGIWSFDIHNNKNLIPLGAGFGKVLKIGNAIVNAFIEPQFTVYNNGSGLPPFQLLSGLNFQLRKKSD